MDKRKALKGVLVYSTIIILIIFAFYGAAYIQTDVAPVNSKIIIIDPGHGMPDGGTVAEDGTKESELNLKIANELRKIAIKKGATVIMTRVDNNSLSSSKTNNKNEDMKARRKIIESSKADVFVSIHMNSFPDSKYHGAQVFYNGSSQSNKNFARCIQNWLILISSPKNTRTIKEDNSIYLLKNNPLPSVLVECGFLSNPEECKKLKTKKYQKIIAKAIFKGINNYFENN